MEILKGIETEDILSYDETGKEKYIEVKTTKGAADTTIHISSHELYASVVYSEQYYLYRVYDFNPTILDGKILVRKGELTEVCVTPISYKVDFQ